MAIPSTFGTRFRFARDFQRLHKRWTTDGELADELGLDSQSQISNYKSLVWPPPAPRVLAIAKRTGVDAGWLAFGSDCEAPIPEGFEEWLFNRMREGPEPPMAPAEMFEEVTSAPTKRRRRGS